MRHRLDKRAGFTLIELSFASGILLVTLGLIFTCMANMVTVGWVAEQKEVAITIAASQMEALRALPPKDRLLYQVDSHFEERDGTVVTVEVADGTGNWVALPLENTALGETLPNPMEIRVAVECRTRRGHPIHTVTTGLFRR